MPERPNTRRFPNSRGGMLASLASWYVFTAALLFAIYYLLAASGMVESVGIGLALAAFAPLVSAAPLLAVIARLNQTLSQRRAELNRAATYDQATGCLNGTSFAGFVERRTSQPSGKAQGAFLIIEVDGLWHLQVAGAHAGEDWPRRVASAIRESVRSGDFVGRISDDGFGVFLPGADGDDAVAIGRRIQSAVASLRIEDDGLPVEISASVAGVVYEGEVNYDALLRNAAGRLPRSSAGASEFSVAPYSAQASRTH